MDFGNVFIGDGPIRILLVDGDRVRATETADRLAAHDDIEVATASDSESALGRVLTSSFDCVVSEYVLDGISGIELLRTVRESHPSLPFVLFTRHGSEDVASEAIGAGVTDYVRNDGTQDAFDDLADRIRDCVDAPDQSDHVDQSDAWYQAIVEQSLVGLYIIRENRVAFVNDYLLDLLGYEATDVVGRPLVEFVSEEDRSLVESRLQSRLRGNIDTMSYTADVYTKDGETVTLEVTGRRVTFGDETVIVGAATDVTARLASERQMKQSERITRQIISSLPDMVFLSEPDEFDIVYINDTFEEVWGRSKGTLYENPLSFLELVHIDDRERLRRDIERLFEDIHAGATDDRYEFEFRFTPEGTDTIRWASARAVPLFDDDGNITNVLGVMTDLTDRIKREQELAQQNSRLEVFARVLSHDIRGPLAVAQGRLDLARETGDDDHLDHVERAHHRIREVVEDVLSLATDDRSAIDLSEVALAESAATAWEMCASDVDDASLEVGELPVVQADESRAKRLFENLFRNAIQHATPYDDSQLVIRVGSLPSRRGFYVEDNGQGIPRSVRDDVFDTGVTTKADGGSGLGLGIVRQIVHTHGWVVRTADSDGSGARFEVLFDTLGDDDDPV